MLLEAAETHGLVGLITQNLYQTIFKKLVIRAAV